MWYYSVVLPNCNCYVDDYNNLTIFIDGCEVWVERGCGFNEGLVYDTLNELGYL